ncbi:hypothetical protein D3C72_1293020 [compost metagenome]
MLELLGQFGFQTREYCLEFFAAGGFDRIADGAHVHGRLHAVFNRNDMHRNVPGAGLLLEALQHGEAGVIRQAHIQQNRVGNETRRQLIALISGLGNQTAITQLMGQVIENAGKIRLIFDH